MLDRMRSMPVLWGVATLLASPAGAEPTPRVITDTPEYCGALVARLSANPAAALEPSRSLAAQGVELCGNGHVRTGIAKLRRALRAAQAAQASKLTGERTLRD
jgi:hypothetical protein